MPRPPVILRVAGLVRSGLGPEEAATGWMLNKGPTLRRVGPAAQRPRLHARGRLSSLRVPTRLMLDGMEWRSVFGDEFAAVAS